MNSVNRFQAVAYAVALLVFGGVIGAMIKSSMSPVHQPLLLGRVDEIATVMTQRLDDKLHLTPEQKQQIAPIIRKAAEEMEASHLNCLKEVNKVADNLHAQIKPMLTKEQVDKLPELEAERSQRMWEKYHYQAVTNASQR